VQEAIAPETPIERPASEAQAPLPAAVQTAASAAPAALPVATTEPTAPSHPVRPVAASTSVTRKPAAGARCSDIVQRASLEPVTTRQALRLKEFCQ